MMLRKIIKNINVKLLGKHNVLNATAAFIVCLNLGADQNIIKMYHYDIGGYKMKETKQSLSELWSLLRNKEEQFGLKRLSLTERDIFQTIMHFQGEDKYISLWNCLWWFILHLTFNPS